jgi:hypothetical protein
MPNSSEILAGLQAIANDYKVIAIIWHAIFYILLIALIAKWKPSNRLLASFISLPIFSVAILAWVSGNPFNGLLFSILGILILFFGLRTSTKSVMQAQTPCFSIGSIMIGFGLLYPHFVQTDTALTYFYASPVGLIPCPTLSVIIGMLFIFNKFRSPYILYITSAFGLFYGFFGVFKLGVYIDLFLAIGTILLLARHIWLRISIKEL